MRYLLLLAALVTTALGHPLITEFMADNTTGIVDEDGANSDWIEIHNPTASPVALADYCLTDEAGNLTKWRFPVQSLEPGGFMLVWASSKNRTVAGLPLHTDFSLSKNGEFLALVHSPLPAGPTTAVQSWNPFPSQQSDESYGLQFTTTDLLANGAAVKYHVPSDGSLGTTWTGTGFGDGSWTLGTTGLGFGITMPGITVREVKKASGIVLSLSAADTLLGGTGIGSETTVVLPVLNLLGDGSDGRYANNYNYPNGAGDHFAVKATGFVVIPTAGTWSFGLNSSSGGRIRIDGADVMVDNTNHAPIDRIGSVTLTAGTHSFEVVNWDEAAGEALEFYARAGTPVAANVWDANFRLVGDTANGGLQAFTVPTGSGGVIGTNVQSVMQGINSTIYARAAFTAPGAGAFSSLSLKVRYADGFVAYMNGAQIAAANAPGSPQWNSAATSARSPEQALVPESVNLTSLIPSLIAGTNVLSFHGMNDSAADGAFLALPELTGFTANTGVENVFFGGGLATPGNVNGQFSLIGRVADTQFSVKRGFFTAPFALAITSATPGATIRYTTNGAEPTATTGTVYASPINITGTTVIRAAAYKNGWEPTDVDTQTYLFLNDVITQSPTGAPPPGWPSTSGTAQILDYGMDPDIVNSGNPAIGGQAQVIAALQSISTICITTPLSSLFNISGSQGIYSNPGNRGFAWERACSIEMINPPGAGFPNGTSEFQVGAGIRIRGGYSRSTDNPKHAFHLYFRGDYGDKKLNYPMFGRHGTDEFDQIDLRTAQNYSWSFGGNGNNTFMREESTRLAQLAMGHQSGRLRYLHVYINGIYWGLFETEERTEASFGATYYGGDKADYDVVKNAGNAGGYQTEMTDGNFTAWQELWTKGRAHKSNPTNAAFFAMQGLAADGVTPTADPVLLDLDNTIDYNLLTFYTGNLDGSTSAFLGNHTSNNWFGSRNRLGTKGGFKFFAHDFEHSLFNVAEDRTGPYTGTNDANFAHSSPMFLHQDLTPNVEYRMRFADRVHKHMFNDGALTPAAWIARWGKIAAIVDGAIIAESARWGDAKVATPRTRNDWINAKNALNSYPSARFSNVISQLRGDGLYPTLDAPTIAPWGGYQDSGVEASMTAPGGGTIYYMPDGTDPRAIGGAIRAGAQTYSSSTVVDVLVPISASGWKYLADGTDQGTAWRGVGFNDTSWPSGAAELGYGDGDEVTVVPYVDADPVTAGVQKNATTYFRRTFNAENVAGITGLSLQVKYDDAIIVYINGQFAALAGNIAQGAAYNYYTNSAGEYPAVDLQISPTLLVNGTNTVAVEIHQADSGSSDISMDLSLTATRSSTATPLFLNGDGVTPLRVRAYNAGTWSALADATFLLNTEAASTANLAVTEIMYNPLPATAAEVAAGFTSGEDFEFLEITNIGSKNIDLEGVYLYGPIDFDFTGAATGRILAPGASVIIAAKKSAFAFRYGAGFPVAGSYKGSLDNAGEQIVIYTPGEAPIRSFTYDDLAPWPVGADGAGYSLVRKLPNADGAADNDPANWRISTIIGGDPGTTVTLAGWKYANGVTNDDSDDDDDTISAKLEYVLGGGPGASDLGKLPVVAIAPLTVGGITQNYVTITFTRRAGADDVSLVVEGTDFVTGWNANATVLHSVTPSAPGLETVVFRSAAPFAGSGKQSYRVKATITQ